MSPLCLRVCSCGKTAWKWESCEDPAWLIRGFSKFIQIGLEPTREAEKLAAPIRHEHVPCYHIMILLILERDEVGLVGYFVSLLQHELFATLLGDSRSTVERIPSKDGAPSLAWKEKSLASMVVDEECWRGEIVVLFVGESDGMGLVRSSVIQLQQEPFHHFLCR